MRHELITASGSARRPRRRGRAGAVPHPRHEVHGKPLVYLDSAATAQQPRGRARRGATASTARATPTSTAACTRSRSAPPRPTRRRARRVARFLGAAAPGGGRLHPRHHRGDQPGGRSFGRPRARPRRRGADHRDGAPLQHRALAAGLRGDRRAAGGGAGRRPRRAAARRVRAAAVAAHPRRRRASTSRTPWARSTRCARSPTARTPRARWCWSTARRRRPTCAIDVAGAGLRLLRLLGPQGLRPDRHRRALGAPRAARRDAALAGRRRHDPPRLVRGHRLRAAAGPLRGRARPTARAPSAWAPRSTGSRALGPEAVAAHEAELLALRHRAARRGPRRAPGRHRAAARPRVALVPARRRARARRRHHPRPRGRGGPRRPPLRAAADGALRRAGHGARLASPSTTPATRWRRSARAPAPRRGSCSGR